MARGKAGTSEPNRGVEEAKTTTTGTESSRDTGTNEKGRGSTTGTTDTNTTTPPTAGIPKEKGLPRLAVLDGTESSEEVPTPKKAKRKRSKPTKKNDTNFNAEQITAILMTASAVMQNTETGKFFALTEKECNQIAVPLANIIAKNDAFNGLSEHSDSIALTTACFMIFLPKIFVFLTYQKTKNELKKNNVKIIKGVETNGNNEAGKTVGSDNGVVKPSTTDSKTSNRPIKQELPAIM